jgi:hypothetical protein
VLVDPGQSSAWYFDTLAAAGAKVVRAMDPCTLPRACKNDVEIAGTREAHKRDGAALTRFLHWLATDGQVNPPDEKEAVAKLEAFREATGVLKDLSSTPSARPTAMAPCPTTVRPSAATSARPWARCCWSTAAASIWTAPPTSPARSRSASPRPRWSPATPWC